MSSSIRLYVYIRMNRLPAVVEIEFPESETMLADRYRESIRGMKRLPPGRQTKHIVAFELPYSVLDLEANRYYGALVLHFETEDEARRFKDDICCGSIGHPRQVIIKQYYNPGEAADLKRSLHVEGGHRGGIMIFQSERSGEPPGGRASGSRSQHP